MTKNKSKTFLLCFLLFTFPFQSNASEVELIKRDGFLYEKFSNIPFTGQVSEKYFDGKVKNGKPEGEVLSYHENGQLEAKYNFKNGKKEGEQLYYDENGQIIK